MTLATSRRSPLMTLTLGMTLGMTLGACADKSPQRQPEAKLAQPAAKIASVHATTVRQDALYVELRLSEEEQAALEELDESLLERELPLQTPSLPPAASSPTRYVVLTPQGPVPAQPARAASIQRLAQPHLYHVLAKPPGVADTTPQLAVVVASGQLSSDARVIPGAPATPSEDARRAILDSIRQRLAKSSDPTALERFDPSQVTTWRGRFGASRTWLIAYSVPSAATLDQEEHDGAAQHVSGIFLTRESGDDPLDAELPDAPGRVVLDSLADLEGDGIHEVIFSQIYYEGYQQLVLQLGPEGPQTTAIAGEGA